MKKLIITAVVICVAIAACKKDENNNTTTTGGRQDTLTTGKWHVTAATATTSIFGKDTTIDLLASFDPCAKDDRYLFQTNGSVINDQHTLKCDTSGPVQTPGGTWALSTKSDTLRMSGGTLPGNFMILSFSNSAMQLRADTNYSGFPVKLNASFQHD